MDDTRPAGGAAATTAHAHRRAARRVVVLGALMLAVVIALAAYDITQRYRAGLAEIERALDTDGREAAHLTARLVGDVDALLQRAAGSTRFDATELHNLAATSPLLEKLAAYSAAGEPLAEPRSSRLPAIGHLTWFKTLSERAITAPVFGDPTRDPSSGRWLLPLAQRRGNARGAFDGALVAWLRIDAFQERYRDAYPSLRVALVHRDTTLLARHPSADDALGRKAAVVTDLLARAAAGRIVTRDLSPIDAVDRFAATHEVDGYPLVVVVTRESAPALAPVREQMFDAALRALAVVAAALLLALVLRARRRRDGAGPATRPIEWPRSRIALASGLFIAAIAAFALYDVLHSYRTATDATAHELDTHARILAEQTARSVAAVDVVTRHVAETFRQGALSRLDRQALGSYLKEQGVGVVAIEGLLLADQQGNLLGASYVAPEKSVATNIATAPIFAAVRDQRDDIAKLGVARRSVIDGRWQFPLSRRLEDAGGAFAGAVVARFRVEYFQNFYRDVRLGPGTTVTLVHHDGTVAARFPPLEAALGQRLARLGDLIAQGAPLGADPLRAVSPLDGVERFGALRLVPDYPLAVLVSRDTDAALAPWRSQAIGTAARTLTLGVLAALLLAALLRQLARVDGARRAVEATQARFAAAVIGSEGGIWEQDYIAGLGYGSPRLRELLGLPPGPDLQPLARQQAEIEAQVHPDDVARRRAALDTHLQGRAPAYDVDYRARQPDGSWRWVHVHGRCIRDAAGNALRMAGSSIDIDARKRAEDQLRQSEERYALAMTGSNEAHWVWDVATDTLHASTSLRDLYGIAHETPLPLRADFVRHIPLAPGEKDRVDSVWNDMIEGRTDRIDLEYRIVDPATGAARWVHTRGQCFRGDDGRPQRVAGATVDVSERKNAEAALRTSEERLALVIAGSNEGILDWDVVNDRMYVSERAQRIFGLDLRTGVYTQAEWAALVMPRFHPDDAGRLVEELRGDASNPAATHDGEYRVRAPNGDYRWTRFRGITIRDASGRAVRWAGSLSDIDDRKRSEERRRLLEDKLRQAQKLEAIGTLAGGIAHDFNNILAAILGYGELAQRDIAEGTPLRRHIDAAVSAGQRGKLLVERILAFSRSGMGERVPVHVQSLVEEALDAVAASLPPPVTLVRALNGGDAGLVGDPTQVHQVVMNLCTNAAHAMGGGGRLEVRLDRVELNAPLAVATSTLPEGAFLRLAIADTGSGIAPEVLGRIFDPFFTTKEVGVGTGLGLSLVHGIVTDLGGGIAVLSEPGRGSCFTVYLPCAVPVVQRTVEQRVTEAERGNGETILLVDDESSLVRLGEETLAELGYEPVGYASSTAALQAFRAAPERFDAIVSDEAMPGLTGSELVREVRALRPHLPVLLMSGFVTALLAERANALGVSAVLGKPLAARELARALAEALRGSAAGRL